jgi:phosphate transport system permease protein
MAVVGADAAAATAGNSHGIVISRARRVRSLLWWTLSGLSLALLALPVVWILVGVIAKGVSVWNWGVLVHTTSGVGGYGLANAIVGTLMMTVGVAIVAGLVGISGGIYLDEFAGGGKFAAVLRSAGEVLSGIPSIVFGFCGYLTLVIGLRWNFSYLPAVIVLSMLVVPYIAKATELSLNQVLAAYREGAEGLGMSKVYLLRKIVLRSALPGMLTGLIIAPAISVGETAPLLYTAGFPNAFPSFALIGNRSSETHSATSRRPRTSS